MIYRKLLPALFLSLIVAFHTVAQTIPIVREINTGWKFHKVGSIDWHNATVPGCVHTDLIAAKLIPDPFYRDNESKLQWIDKYSWEYKTSFMADRNTVDRGNIELCFKGLDTYAEVYLNDQHLLSTDNMFCEWKSDVKQILKEGNNSLRILFHSPVVMGSLNRDKFNLEAPIGYNFEFANNDWPNVGPYTRKAGYMYGWDWGPKLTTSGIWRPVVLMAWDNGRIVSQQIVQHDLTPKKASVSSIFTIEAASALEGVLHVSYTLHGKSTPVNPVPVKLQKGLNEVKVDFVINNPELWWPNGLGNHPVYEFSGTLSVNDKTIDEYSTKFGLRTIRLVQKPEADGGKSFYFEVNGMPVFAKGANYIPSDIFPSRVTRTHYEELIRAAADAHMNMLRVWGGGIYENDVFYDLCDQYGLMIWQDFAFAIYQVPDYPEFYASIQHELKDNILRIRNHACLAAWCGNNESEMIWNLLEKNFFGLPIDKENKTDMLDNLLKLLPKSDSINPAVTARVMKGYDDIFYTMIPEALEKYDYNTHDYWPSSPAGGWKKPVTNKVPQSGDMHFYIAVLNLPFSAYLEIRSHFFSEHGFQAWPDKKVVEQFTALGDRKVNSPIMNAHNKALGGNAILDKYISMYYHTPKDFDSYLYISQVLQAEGLKLALETHRRWMPYTMGTLYWQLNDVWPVASWASLDYQNNPKALEFIVKKAFSEVIVVPSDFKNDFKINVVSDSRESFKAKMEARITDFEGRELWKKSLSVNVRANTSEEIYKMKTNELVKNMDTTRIVFTVKILQNNKLLASNLCYFSATKNLKLEKPLISKTISATDQGYLITLSSDKLVKDLYLSTDEKGQFTDNYFDLLPGEKVTVNFNTKEKIENFESKLNLVSVADTY